MNLDEKLLVLFLEGRVTKDQLASLTGDVKQLEKASAVMQMSVVKTWTPSAEQAVSAS